MFESWIGEKALFWNDDSKVTVMIVDVRGYPILYGYLDAEGIDKVLPGVESYNDVVEIYHGFYTDNKIMEAGGMCGIEVELVDE